MQTIDIKGVLIGAGRPKTIVSLMDADVAGLLASARAAVAAGADCLEWRADFFDEVRDHDAVAAACRALAEAFPRTPLIFTLRTAGQGGWLALDRASYLALLRSVVQLGAPDLVDVELSAGDDEVRALAELAHRRGVRAIVSHHDFSATPPVGQMWQILAQEADLGADIPKLAVMARDAGDCTALLMATAAASQELDRPLITMAMGKHGALSRLAGEAFGSALTFCALGEASAPGQVELTRAVAAMDALHDALPARD